MANFSGWSQARKCLKLSAARGKLRRGDPLEPHGEALSLVGMCAAVRISPGVTWLGFEPGLSANQLCELRLVTSTG